MANQDKNKKYQPTNEPRPDKPKGTFGNEGEAEGEILNK